MEKYLGSLFDFDTFVGMCHQCVCNALVCYKNSLLKDELSFGSRYPMHESNGCKNLLRNRCCSSSNMKVCQSIAYPPCCQNNVKKYILKISLVDFSASISDYTLMHIQTIVKSRGTISSNSRSPNTTF